MPAQAENPSGDILGADRDAGLLAVPDWQDRHFDMCSYVAVDRAALRQALNYLAAGKSKGGRAGAQDQCVDNGEGIMIKHFNPE
jgi:hypothetical protein